MSRLCRERGIPFVLVVIPGGGPPDFAEPYEVLDAFARKLFIPVIHLLPGFVGHSYNETHYPLDGHWNPGGNRLAAAIIDRELRRLNLLPAPKYIQQSDPARTALLGPWFNYEFRTRDGEGAAQANATASHRWLR